MFSKKRSSELPPVWALYGVAVASVVLGWLARETLTPAVGPTALPFIFFFPAVAIAAWYGGLRPGVLAVLLSLAAAHWFFIEPIHSWAISKGGDIAALAAFLVSGLFIVGAMEAMHRANARARAELTARERAEAELASLRDKFATTLAGVSELAATSAQTISRTPLLQSDGRDARPPARLITPIFLAAAALLVGTTIFVYRVGLSRIHAQRTMASELRALQQLDNLLSSLNEAEAGQHGYLLTGDEPYLQPYASVRDAVRMRLDELQRLAQAGNLPKTNVEQVAALTQERLAIIEQTIQLRREKGSEAAVAVMRTGRGKQLMDDIRARIGQMRADEEKEFTAASNRASWTADVRTATFIGACLLNLAFLAWAFRKISGEVHRRETATLETSQQKELLATTLASIGDGVIVSDAQGRVTFLNGEAERLTGWKSAEAAGRPLPEIFGIIDEQRREPVENPVEKVLRLGAVVGLANHTLLIARDGRETPIDDSAAPIRVAGGPLFGVVLVFRDVTEQRKAQHAAACLAAIVEHSGDAMFTKNLDGIVQTWNSSAERLLGYRAEEIVGKPVSVLFPQDRLNEEDHIVQRLREGRPAERFETIRVAKSGRRIPVAVSVSPLKDGEGQIIGASKIIHDITEIVAAREALVREKELLATTLASIGDGVIVTDANGRVTFLNEEAERLTGWKNADAAGRQLPEIFHIINTQTRQPVENPVEKVLRLGGVVGLANHTILIAKDGRETPIDDSAAPIRREDGPLFGVVLVFRDVIQQQKAQDVLRESQERLAGLIDSAMDAVIAVDAQQRVILFNPAAERMFGCPATEALGGPLDRFIPARFRKAHRGHIENFGQTGVTTRRMGALGALSGLRSNGEEFPIEAAISQMEVGGQKLFTVILRDITERKKAEAQQSQLAAIVESSRDAILSKSLDGIVTSWNAGAQALFGYSASEMIGQPIRGIIPDELVTEEETVSSRVRTGQSVDYETVRLTKAGKRVPVIVSISPIKEATGKIVGASKIIRDITEQKRTNEALREAQRKLLLHTGDLEQIVAERTASLREMVTELQQLSYSMAHDMRAPLRAMAGFAQALLEECLADSRDSAAQDYCRRIQTAASRLDKLIQDALNYSKTVLQEPRMEPVDLSKLLRGIIATYPNLQANKAEIRIEGELPVVLGNESLLTQCFSNLLGNAVKFVASGIKPQVRVWAETAGSLARIWVEDNGIGIPEHPRGRLFGMFQRLNTEYEGTGVGLAIVRKVVERMGGRVGVESKVGSGSRFWVELPTAASTAEPIEAGEKP